MTDERPAKRQRLEPPQTRPIPPETLLLALPSFLAHPPTHRNHTHSLILSQLALRKYLALPELDSISEFRALVELAEIGFRIGLSEPGVESEVGRVISRALVIVGKHPSLRIHKVHVTTLSARLALYQKNYKSAQNVLKKLLTTFLAPSDPPHVVYAAHLAYISSLTDYAEPGEDAGARSSHLALLRANGNTKAQAAIRELGALAARTGHREVELLALVLELRDLVHNGVWRRVGAVLANAEKALGLLDEVPCAAPAKSPSKSEAAAVDQIPVPATTTKTYTPLEHVLRVHVVMAAVLYHTYVGEHAEAQARIKKMHEMLDGAAFEAFGPHGVVDVQLSSSPPLRIQVTHPRTLFSIGFLVSSVAKRDPTGRRPKRRQFAAEGVKVVDNELKKELNVPMWASVSDVQGFRERMNKIRADMICELIGISIQRSEFDEAEHHISQLIAHIRTHNLFSTYSARLTLHQAHLAHALGLHDRALKCYRVAAHLSRTRIRSNKPFSSSSPSYSSSPPSSSASPRKGTAHGTQPTREEHEGEEEEDEGQEDHWVNVSARAGDLWLRVGLVGEREHAADQDAWARAMAPLREEGKVVVEECKGLGGTLNAVGAVLAACLGVECMDVKINLRSALTLCTTAEDNYLRPLVFALCADQYFHTATDHALMMLETADGLAAGLGAQPKPKAAVGAGDGTKPPPPPAAAADKVGNAHLRMWIGERALELKRRKGDEDAAARQTVLNEALRKAVARVEKRRVEVEEQAVVVR